MRVCLLLAAITGSFFPVIAGAGAVETSLRPQARPGTTMVVQPAAEPATAGAIQLAAVLTAPARSLRPMARPGELHAEPVAPEVFVSTSNAAFDRWIKGFRGRALANGIKGSIYDRAFANIRYNTEVIQKDRHQSEFTKQIWDYLDSAASPPRIDNGKKALRKHAKAFRRIEQTYGVDKEVVAAVWGVESTYGTRMGTYNMIEALATLSFDGRRGAFFQKQLIAALKILQSGDVSVQNFKGSWAGAMGHTQFIPTSYQAYAVDFTGDGKRDIWSNNPTDALASTAAYLKRFGWIKGQPWGVEVALPRGFKSSSASRKIKKMPSEWARLGVLGTNGKPVPDYGSASVLLPAGTSGAAFLIFKNFAVLERYNNSDAYVIAVGHLSDRLKGRPAIKANWPRGYDPLTFKEKMDMQRRLKRKGYKVEKIDGLIGPNTVAAIKGFQQSIGVKPDGFPSKTLLKQLRGR